MKQIVYRPGAWLVVVEDAGVIAVPAGTDPARIHRLSELLQAGAPALTEVIDVLADGSITALGSFAVALDGPEGIRFAVRGPVDVRIAGTAADERVSGADVSTWSERFVANSRGFELVLDEAQTPADYPIRSGVVLAGAVRVGEMGAAPTIADEPAPSEADAAAPVAAAPVAAAQAPDEVAPVVADAADPQPLLTEPEPTATELPVTEPIDQVDAEELEATVGVEPAPGQTLLPNEFTYTPEQAAEDQPADAADDASPSLDDLFPEATVQVAPAAASVAPPAPAAATTGADLGDHDGATVSVAEARRMRAETSSPDAPTAVLPVAEQAAPTTGRVRVSSGQVVELDRTVIIGRRPRATRASGNTLPHLVAVESPQQDISRSHLEVRPEGDSVVVIDLHTTNGSTLLRPGSDPMRLHPGEHTLVTDGDVVDLGDGITVSFEGLA